MTDEAYKKWDLTIKTIAPIITVLGLLVGVWQFTRGQSAQLEREYKLLEEKDRIEFKQRTWAKQVEVYTKVSNVVGRIAAEDLSDDELKKTIGQFYTLYWGDMLYVEDEAVEQAMIDFHVEIQDYLKEIGNRDRLKVRAKQLIEVSRQSSRNHWFTR